MRDEGGGGGEEGGKARGCDVIVVVGGGSDGVSVPRHVYSLIQYHPPTPAASLPNYSSCFCPSLMPNLQNLDK